MFYRDTITYRYRHHPHDKPNVHDVQAYGAGLGLRRRGDCQHNCHNRRNGRHKFNWLERILGKATLI
jgi:hypothetical protein